MQERDLKFMQEAFKEALIALEKDEVPIGAVIVHNNTIIARAHNLTNCLNDVTAHAEMLAITAAANYMGGKYLSNCTLYVTVEPCPMCMAALNWSQIERVVYGTEDIKRGFSLYNPSLAHPKCKIEKGVMREESAELMSNFFKTKR